MLISVNKLKDFDLGLELKVGFKNPKIDDDLCFLKILIGDSVFLSVISSFNGYYFHTRLKENNKNFKEEIYKIVASFNPISFSQDFNFANNFFQEIFERKDVKLENIPVKPFLNVFYPLAGYIDNFDNINFQANMNFCWKGDLLDISIYVMRNPYMVLNVDVEEFSNYNGYPVKFFNVSNGKMFFVIPFDINFYATKMGDVFRIFSEKEGIIYERFIFNIYNTLEGYIVYWASNLGINQLTFPKNYNPFSIVFSCLVNYLGNFLDFTKAFEIRVPYWMLRKNGDLTELVNKFYYYESNSNFYSFVDVVNYKGIFYEIVVDFMIGLSKDWFFYIKTAAEYDKDFYIQNHVRLLDKKRKILDAIKFVEEFNRNYHNKMVSLNSWVYDKQISDIIHRNTMQEIEHQRKIYEKIKQTNNNINNMYREAIKETNKSREAFTKGFSAAINNETYVRSQTGEIYRVPRTQEFSKINYYEDQDLIVGVKNYDYSNSQYLQSLGFKKMEEDMFGFVDE